MRNYLLARGLLWSMCYSNVSWHQTWKVLLHTSARLSEAHHTVTLLSSEGKNTLSHLQSKLQSCSLQSSSYSRILKFYHQFKEILINTDICSWAMLRTHSAQAAHTQVSPTLMSKVRIRCSGVETVGQM